ncbi:MAG: NINE protein [Planctomycetes bacterium]|nr:NINE protein [Planctomycetota bacterium]
MVCPQCGRALNSNIATCPGCGSAVEPQAGAAPRATIGGFPPPPRASNDAKTEPDAAAVADFAGRKVAAGICGILLGALGVHKFILGLTTPGIIMLLITILTCGFAGPLMHVIGLVEGIIYLTKSNADFYKTYAVEKKGWF